MVELLALPVEAIAAAVRGQTTAYWLDILQPADIWCAEVQDWPGLMASAAFHHLDMVQHIEGHGVSLNTLRGPLRIDGQVLANPRAAPGLGEGRDRLIREFGLVAQPGRKDALRATAT